MKRILSLVLWLALGGAVVSGQIVSGPVPGGTETDPVYVAAKDTDGTLATNSDAKVASQKAVKTYVDAITPYKVYVALLTQSGTDAPVATVLQNTLGGTVVWTRSGFGTYIGTLTGAFSANKTVAFITGDSETVRGLAGVFGLSRFDSNTVNLSNYSVVDGGPEDSLLTGASVEIRVYPP